MSLPFWFLWKHITGPCTRLADAEDVSRQSALFSLLLTSQRRVCLLEFSMEGGDTLTEPKPLTLTPVLTVTHKKPQFRVPQAEEIN